MINEVLILAAGRGKRLDRPSTHKSLLEVGGKKIIFRQIEQFINAGIDKINIVIGHDGQKVKAAVTAGFINKVQLNFIYADNWQKGIAFSALCAKDHIKKTFMLCMGDHIFDDILIGQMANQTVDSGKIKLLVDPAVDNKKDVQSFVKVLTSDKKIEADKLDLENYNGFDTGLFVCSPEVFFAALEKETKVNKSNTLYGAMDIVAKDSNLYAVFIEKGHWNDIDTPIDSIYAEMRLRKQHSVHKIKQIAPADSNASVATYDFIAGEPQLTSMVVGRGFLNNPQMVDLIPVQSSSSAIFVFSDATVGELYAKQFAEKLKKTGYNVHLLLMADGEESKSLANYVRLTQKVLSLGVDERSVFISVGGGVVCNVCGFIASTIYRGLDLVHLPTSLMAQCDAAISHKQAINGFQGKNMIGSYYSPRMVAVDVESLLTLNSRQIRDGMSEVIKHALGQSPAYVEMLMNYTGSFIKDLGFLETVVKKNIELKCMLSKHDPKELAEAMVLQYGHTIGHPVEHLSGYSLYHGESVAIGMVAAAHVSHIMGGADKDLVKIHKSLIEKYQLPAAIPKDISSKNILQSLKFNKRYLREGTRMALLKKAGVLWNVDNDFVIPVPDQVLLEAFANCSAQ